MGWADRITKTLEGAADIFSAPIGFAVDLTRSFSDDDIDFGDPFSTGMGRLGGGIAKISEATGLDTVGSELEKRTPIDEALGFMIREGELVYNQDMQREMGRTPFGITSVMGQEIQPGDVSIARGLGTVTGLAGNSLSLLPGGTPAGEFLPGLDPRQLYKATEFTSPGQVYMNEVIGTLGLSDKETEELQGSLAYGMTTGVLDSVARWYGQPEVIAGKGAKAIRTRWNPDTNRLIAAFQRKTGMSARVNPNATPGSVGETASMVVEGAGENRLYTVIRNSELNDPHRGRNIVMIASEEDAMRYASELWRQNPADMPMVVKVNPEGMPVLVDDVTQPFARGADGFADDVGIVGLTDDLDSYVDDVSFPDEASLDPNAAKWIEDPGAMPDHLKPKGKLSEVLYSPEGRAIEPRDLYAGTSVEETILGARQAFEEGGETMATKFLNARQVELQGGDRALVDFVTGGKRTQRAINDMLGKDPAYLRRVYFDQVPTADTLSVMVSEAKTYREIQDILASAAGIQTGRASTLSVINRAKIKLLNEDLEDLKLGREVAARRKTVYQSMTDGTDWSADAAKRQQLIDAVEEEISQTQDMALLGDFLETAQVRATLKTPPRYSRTGHAMERMRESHFYQSSPLSRPVRVTVEKRPHRFVHTQDPQADTQIVRQLEEARPLGITQETVDRYRNRWLAATTEQEKVRIANQMENEIVTAAARRAGLSKDELTSLIERMRKGKGQTRNKILASRRYSPVADMDIVRWVDDNGELAELAMPVLGTQLQNWIPLTDVRELVRMSTEMGRLRAKYGALPASMMDSFYQLWKPSVLLRGGWPIRVVSDEQLRIMARTGSLINHLAAISLGEKTKWSIVTAKGLSKSQRVAGAFAIPVSTLTAASQRASVAITRGAKKLRLLDAEYLDDMASLGVEKSISARAAFNGPNASVFQEMEMTLGRTEGSILDHLISKGSGQWGHVGIHDPNYSVAWQRALQDQIGRDPLARIVLTVVRDGGDSAAAKKAALKWLRSTPEGKEYASRMPWRSKTGNLAPWVDDVEELTSYYTAGYNGDLVNGALGKKVTTRMLGRVDEGQRPLTVHGEIIEQGLGNSVINQTMADFLSTAYDMMGRLPTDTLSRQPMFKEIFGLEMRRIRRTLRSQGVDVADESVIQQMAYTAKSNARDEVMTYLYNLAEVSELGHMMRWWFPFFPAWQEVLEVWGKLSVRDPSVPARAMLIWNAPNRANIVAKDDEGNEFIQIRMSEKMSDKLNLTGFSKYIAEGGFRFGKGSFNMITNSVLPGVGPPIQMAVNEVVKSKPELEEALGFLIPFGVKANAWDVVKSPLIGKIGAWIGGPEGDRAYERHFTNVLTWMDFQYRAGYREDPPDLEEAHDLARKLFAVQTFASYTSPAQPIIDSPLKPYMDIYQDLQDTYGSDADEIFLNQYGAEFFSLTISKTVSKSGISPTVEAQVARRQYEDMISDHPELGRLIIGEDAAIGEFSSAAFAWQMSNPPTDDPAFRDEAERQYRILELDPDTGRIEEADTRLGWTEYIKAMDLVDLELKKRGLPSLRVKEAEDLANLKRALTNTIAEKYPSWWRDFNVRNDLKWDQRIKDFRGIANDPLMDERADMLGIRAYIEGRDLIRNELNRRKQLGGSSTLSAQSNQDLSILWEAMVTKITSDYIAFKPIWHRYLEGDPLT